MKQAGARMKRAGFTIVETMIVLAVSGSLLAIAIATINGRQAKTEFQTSLRNAQTKIQQIVNEVESGYYPANDDFTCSVVPGTLQISRSGTIKQGAHEGCIFLGKAVVVDRSTIYAYSLAGRRQNSSNADVQTPKEAQATVVAPTNSGNVNAPDATEVFSIPYGVEIVSYAEDSGLVNTKQIYGFTVLSSLAGTNGVGSQTVDLYGFGTSTQARFAVGATKPELARIINDEQAANPAYPKRSQIRMCLRSGGTEQSAWLIIGSSTGGGTTVSTQIRNNTTCS